MTTKRLLVIGSGERVRKAALPVFERSEGFDIEGIISRTPKTIEADGKEYPVLGLDSLTRERLSGIDLIYMVVKKGAVPGLLATIAKLGPTHVDLLIETPVMLVRHLGHRKRLDCFRNVWVSEDCETLPCWDAVKGLLASGALGDLRSITLDRSAYAYHGMAMVKSILGGRAIRSAHQTTIQNGLRERRITVDNGLSALVVDPRDYSLGTLLFEGTSATLADFGAESDTRLRLEAQVENGHCVGFRAGDYRRELTAHEVELMGTRSQGAGVTAWMDGMKRVGFLALMNRMHTAEGAYPLDSAIEDSVVDYYLEKFGRYRATPFTRPDAALPRLAFNLLTKILDR